MFNLQIFSIIMKSFLFSKHLLNHFPGEKIIYEIILIEKNISVSFDFINESFIHFDLDFNRIKEYFLNSLSS